MKLTYDWNKDIVEISETQVSNELEFTIRILSDHHFNSMKLVQKNFEANDVITDVLVYPYTNHEYRVVVRNDFYEDFILQLCKYQLVTKVEWKKG
ncbi:hypothetical protein [Paenibacillus sp. P36]|uniref:hypothetical protein n=1 Tax=Paenibacillus sp. P36 TaxID=3342538 RepID=UPI0038B26EF8